MTRTTRSLALAALAAAPWALPLAAQEAPVGIRVDTRERIGPLTPIWAWFGYDEPNYTYMENGRELLSELAEASPVPVYVRVHNLLTSGDGTPSLKWGSTNAYTEDGDGRPVYDWTIVDRIFDTYVERGMKPLVEIGFMPEALSSYDGPYRHHWQPGDEYGDIYTGWAYPPNDYEAWGELVFQWVRHSVERYGREEVESWWWEVWNEPDISYWQGSHEEYLRLYDHAADGLKRALPSARIGGPHVTGPLGRRTQQYLRDFLEHTLRGTNYATGATGSPLDYVGFHAKGGPRVMDEGHVRMDVGQQLRAISNGFEIVASFPELAGIPVILGESDPEGCAACPVATNPSNAYRNGTMYSVYTAEQLARTYELADLHGVNLIGSVTWAFEFEGQPYFYGFRDLATNGIDKPVMSTFRMLGLMSGDRVRATSTGGLSLEQVRDSSVRGAPDVAALATRAERAAAVLVWNYHDDDLPAPDARVELVLEGLPDGAATLTHYRVDREHGDAYGAWQEMGSPQPPSPAQVAELEEASRLATLAFPEAVTVAGGRVALSFALPRQGVSLVTVTW
jgi:xylan 1,4-beta-xylosidase